jgi:hypothetical protein
MRITVKIHQEYLATGACRHEPAAESNSSYLESGIRV